MGTSAAQFADRLDRLIDRYVGNDDVDPHIAELILNQRSQNLRKEHGFPDVTSSDISDEYDFL